MILGIGTDLIMIDRIGRAFQKHGLKFVNRVLSVPEKNFFLSASNPNKKVNFLAKRFSAKESFLKAVGIGMGRGINMYDITINYDKYKKPMIILADEKRAVIEGVLNEKFENLNFLVSLTDENSMVGTFVIIDKVK
jgi:holo-[acyl-carrier protein] synthase